MDAFVPPFTLYDVLLEAIRFDPPEEVLAKVTDYLNRPPKQSQKAKRALSHLVSTIIRLRKLDLLKMLSVPICEHSIPIEGSAAREAVALPSDMAIVYLDTLFTLGWDVNRPLGNSQPPVLSIALHDIRLVRWLLQIGADPNATCDIDYTPLSVAVNRASVSVVQLLLKYGAHATNGYLVYYASQRADINEAIGMVRLLYQHGKPVDEILYHDPKSYCFRAQFLRGTPLYYACKERKSQLALALLELGANPDRACMRYNQITGPTPREVAMEFGWPFLRPQHAGDSPKQCEA